MTSELSTSPGEKDHETMKKRDFESKRGSFQEIGAKMVPNSANLEPKLALLIKLLRKGGKWSKKVGKSSIKKRV